MTMPVTSSGSAGMGLEQNLYFNPSHSISVYAEATRQNGAVTEDTRLLDAAEGRR